MGFGTEKRKGVGKETMSPGPGAYMTRSSAFEFERPRFFMGERIDKLKETTKVPGPDIYDPKPAAIKK